jgi:hypothetical protein
MLLPTGSTPTSAGRSQRLTKLIAPLETAGLVSRAAGGYSVVDSDAMGRLLTAVADLNVSAQRILAERAQLAVADAERFAAEIRAE